MSWERFGHARNLCGSPADAMARLLIESEAAAASLPADEAGKVARFVDEAAARIEHGGALKLAASGPSAHLVRYAIEETASWFPGVLPVGELTAADGASEENAVATVEAAVAPDDVVFAVSRSGARPWTCMALRKANTVGALTASVSCVPDSPLSRESDMPIVVPSGAEVVMGCTQYRAGTVVKVVLDAILLALVARLGGLLGDVPVRADAGPDRWRLVAAAAEVDHLRARSLLAEADGDALVAIVMARRGVGLEEARRRLQQAGGRIDVALAGN